MSKNAIVYGNGESRKEWDLSKKFNDTTTWGCNRIFSEGVQLDNLVCVDYIRQHEVYKSGYAFKNKCWFLDWHIQENIDLLESSTNSSELIDLLKQGVPEEYIFENERNGSDRVVIKGKLPKLKWTDPDLEKYKDSSKIMRDAGLYITWLQDDMVNDITSFRGRNAGGTAMWIACEQGAENVYMMGFDLSIPDKPLSHLYPEFADNPHGFDCINWQTQNKKVFKKFPKVNFYWVTKSVEEQLLVDQFDVCKNVTFLTYKDLDIWK
jgi:hypothetical protein